MSSKVAVVIPNHKEELDELEKISLAQVRKVLKNYPLVFVGPKDKNFSYIKPGEPIVHFPKEYFQTLKGYNILSISPLFYEPFLNFDYILIYQLDAFVFYDALEDFCRLDYDYIGAAWPYYAWQGAKYKKTPRVGNGGFSLRKVKVCHELLKKCSALPNWQAILEGFDEDGFFATCGVIEEENFNVAPIEVAKLFAMEWYPDRHVKKLGNELPFGCHNWTKFSANFYVELFAKFGYDLRPLKVQMGCNDYETMLPDLLAKLALERLTRKVERGQVVLKYLPTKRFASVRVIRSPEAMKILARLLVEENSLADKIFIYDKENAYDSLQNLTCKELPHLLLSANHDEPLISSHVVSFRQEYLKAQEKLFHSLGR